MHRLIILRGEISVDLEMITAPPFLSTPFHHKPRIYYPKKFYIKSTSRVLAMFSSHTYIAGGTFTQHVETKQIQVVKGSFEHLQDAVSPAAFHNSADRRDPPKCHPNTRIAVLEKIMNWILSLDSDTGNSLIMWLLGPAGSGKSAIAQSIAEWAFDEKILVASYFFSRFDSTRNHARSIIATMAYQTASHFPGVRDHMLTAIDADPLIFTRSLITQLCTLIAEPLQHVTESGYFNDPKSRRLVIIDGLDECDDRDGQIDILCAIAKLSQEHHLPFIFLLASRPEHDITNSFNIEPLRKLTSRLPLDNEYKPSDDIQLFLRDKFNEIKANHPFKAQIPPEWSTENTISDLVDKSSGQFIYAATVIKFIKSTRHRPATRLNIVLGLQPTDGGRNMPFAELDALYHYVLSSAQDIKAVLQILGLHILQRSSSIIYGLHRLEEMLSLPPGEVLLQFCDLHSIVYLKDDFPHCPGSAIIEFHHASLVDFLLDKLRSKELYIDAPLRHAELAHKFFPHPSLDPNSTTRLLRACAWHIMHALPNNQLRDDILNLDIVGLCSRGAVGFLPVLLKSIQESLFDDAKELYSHHLQSFDRYVLEQLKNHYYSDRRLTALVSVVSLAEVELISETVLNWQPLLDATVYPIFYDLFQLDTPLKRLDHRSLGFVDEIVWLIKPKESLIQFFQVLFADQTRSGIYAPDAGTYANGAIHFLKFVCDHLSRRMRRYYERTTRRYTPWKSRRKIVLTMAAYKRMINNSPCWRRGWLNNIPIPKKYCDKMWRRDFRGRFGHTDVACYCCMHYLALLLEKAGRLEELIYLARKCTLGLLSRAFLDETRVAKKAIRRYLERMDEIVA